MRRSIEWLARRSGPTRSKYQAAAVGIATYGAALLSAWVADVFETHGVGVVLVHGVVIVLMIGLLSFGAGTVRSAIETLVIQRSRILGHAHVRTDHCVAKEIGRFHSLVGEPTARTVVHDPLAAIGDLVEALFQTLETFYSSSAVPGENILFEVTFMTRSYRDDHITIAAWANREGRAPLSLQMRECNPKVYDRSVTAQIYEADRPVAIIVEDTGDPAQAYAQLYQGQLDRIKSTIVYPVLSDMNTVIGTIVAHCDRVGFFRHKDSGYWRELFEVFVSRIAVEKLRLDQWAESQRGTHTAWPF